MLVNYTISYDLERRINRDGFENEMRSMIALIFQCDEHLVVMKPEHVHPKEPIQKVVRLCVMSKISLKANPGRSSEYKRRITEVVWVPGGTKFTTFFDCLGEVALFVDYAIG